MSHKLVLLKPISQEDAHALLPIWSDPVVTKWTRYSILLSLSEVKARIKQLEQTKHASRYTIRKHDDQTVIGTCGFKRLNFLHETGEIEFELGSAYWRQGFMTAALHELLHIGFDRLELNRLEVKVNADNIASQRLVKRAGFRQEGINRQGRKWEGKFQDVLLFSLLQSEFRSSTIAEPIGQLELLPLAQLTKDSALYMNEIVSEVNDHVVRLAVIDGEYHWHKHDDCDESFFILEGELYIDLEDRTVSLLPGDLFTIPAGVMHRTRSNQRTVNICFEKAANEITGS
ncbi:GNAT family N-acetyltransferase [Terribacillus sp. 179-K 1B1 HS]|uniref:GNAT family N-acetyltransferase n=1 Tax=Terribacillus sp. 179-K 1B1 HS TaxID=3142388 RepID=UPI0039A22831